ncbi:ABC transporter substrate-binding protein [Staphylothermus hellenicus]
MAGSFLKRSFIILVAVFTVLIVVSTMTPLASATHIVSAEKAEPPREETLIIGGGLWNPPTNWNPLLPWVATTGTIGLIYETLYLYEPLNDTLIPWLAAEEPKWLDNQTLQIKLRDAKWSDGTPVTSADVKFTFYELPQMLPSLYYSSMANYTIDVETPDDFTVIFKFNTTAISYPDFYSALYTIPILPRHIFKPIVEEKGAEVLQMEVVGADKPEDIVGSGMYKVYMTTQDAAYLVRNDDWWGKKYFGLPGPKYIKYIMVFSNQVALGLLLRGDLDWSNFFIPGIPDLVKRYNFLVTFYKHPPYYLSATVAYIFVNHNNTIMTPEFRKAMYYAIDIDRIINEVYEGAVVKANPVGLLEIPGWKKFIATDLINSYNYTYDPDKAKKILDEAGYVDIDGDGWREAPDGSKIDLEIIVPYGWTDWMQAAIIIADCLKAVGIKVTPSFPAYGLYSDKMYRGDFDLLINNFGSYGSISPYLVYNWLLWPDAPDIGEYSWSGNFGRYRNENVTELLENISYTPLTDEERLKKLYYELEKIFLDEMPYIPLWCNGYWFQATTFYWTGWPTEENPYTIPVSWSGRWTADAGLLVLLHLKPTHPTITTTTTTTTTTTVPPTTTIPPTITATTTATTTTPPPAPTTTTTTTPPAATGVSATTWAIIITIIIIIIAIILWLYYRRRLR